MSENQAKIIVLIMVLITFLSVFLMYTYQNEIRRFLYPENYVVPVVKHIDKPQVQEENISEAETLKKAQEENRIKVETEVNTILGEDAKKGQVTNETIDKMLEVINNPANIINTNNPTTTK